MSNISLDDIEYDDADADVTELRSPNMRQMMESLMKQQEEIKQMREQLNDVTNKIIEENKKKRLQEQQKQPLSANQVRVRTSRSNRSKAPKIVRY